MKKIIALILSLVLCLTLNGCYDSKEISRIAFVIAVGFDENSYSFQIVKPSAFEGEGSEDSPLLTETVYSSNVYDAMNILNSKVSEVCDYSHMKMVIFSRNVLEKGIEKEVDAMLKSNEFHPNTNTAMCEGKASDYMENMKIPLDANPAEYYENISGFEFTQYSPDTQLKDIQKKYPSHIVGCAIPIINNNGMAITSNFKLTGTADENQTLIYNLLKKPGFDGNFTITNGIVVNFKKTYWDFEIDMSKNPPNITVKLSLEGNIVWSETNTDSSNAEKYAKAKIESDIKNFLNKCSDTYKADILDFHKLAKVNYLTMHSWEKENWQKLYENSTYTVHIDVKIKRNAQTLNEE